MEITETIQKHPVASVAVVAVAFLVLYLALGSGGSSANAAVASGPSDSLQSAEIQAATGLQIAQLGAQSEDNKTNAAAALGELSINAQLLGKYSDNTTAVTINNTNADVTKYGIAANTDLQKTSISAQEAVALGQQRQVTDVAAITSAVNLAGIQANRDTSINSTNALADANRYAAQLNAQTSQLISNNSASVAKNKSNNDFFGNILGIGASLLSFL